MVAAVTAAAKTALAVREAEAGARLVAGLAREASNGSLVFNGVVADKSATTPSYL